MQYWSWILTAVGVFGLWLAGRRNRLGWAVGLGAQVLWVAYALTTEQYGFLVSAGAYGFVYARNFTSWKQPAPVAISPESGDLDGEMEAWKIPKK